eukprot:jgi/Botrbrau1/23473/Bobra.106_1s0027.2
MADTLAFLELAAGPVIKKLKEGLVCIVYCKAEAEQLSKLLGGWVGPGDISRRIMSLPPSHQSQFEAAFWGFLDALEDAQDVCKSALQLKWYQLLGRYHHSCKLRSINKRLEMFKEAGFLSNLQGAAADAALQAVQGTVQTPRTAQQCGVKEENIFQQIDKFIPHLKAQLSAPGEKRNLALCGMPGLGKTTIARRVFEELKAGFNKHLFMTVSKSPDCFQLLTDACKKLVPGMKEFPFRTAAEVRDDLMRQLQKKEWTVLLVLDDVWSEEHLEVLNFATGIMKEQSTLLRDDCSRLIITTRNSGVLSPLKREQSVSEEMPPLLESPHDLHLLCHHAFSNSEPQQEDLWKVVQEVVAECKGNPLMLKVVGGGLRDKILPVDWKQRLEQLRKSDSSLDVTGKVLEICRPSYEELNLVARAGFKLFAAFPEDYQIEERQLLLAWAVMVPVLCQPLEADSWARLQLADLVARSLLMLQPGSYPGAPNKYHMHDVLRDLAISECRKASHSLEPGRRKATVRHMFIQPDQPVEQCFPKGDFEGGCWSCIKTSEHVTELRHVAVLSAAGGWPAHLRGLPNLHYLDLQHSPLQALPSGPLPHLKLLRLSDVPKPARPTKWLMQVEKKSWAEKLCGLTGLNHLALHRCHLPASVEMGISVLTGLQMLDLTGCRSLTYLPEGITALTGLQTLDLSGCRGLNSLAEGISALSGLQTLDLSGCRSLNSLPEGISALTGLRTLALYRCESLTLLSEGISALTGLQTLDLSRCGGLTSLPEGISALTGLRTLALYRCESLISLPGGISALTSLRTLDLCECGSLTSLLEEGISALIGLRTLDLYRCESLTSLPKDISALTSLQTLRYSCVKLTSLSEGLSALTGLQTLVLRECGNLADLPEAISALTGLHTLDLSWCGALFSLPEGISALTGLQTLDLSRCGNLTSLSEGILALKGLQRKSATPKKRCTWMGGTA